MSLPIGSPLGTLRIVDILDEYDGPRLFVAINAVDTYFLAFWADRTDNAEHWLYVPVSERRLNELYSGSIPIRQAYLKPEEPVVYFITESLEIPGDFTCKALSPTELDVDFLPPPDDCLTLGEQFSALDGSISPGAAFSSVHRISVNLGRKVDFASVSRVLSAWTSAIKAATQLPFVPVGAAVGSFVVNLGANESAAIDKFFRSLHQNLSTDLEISANETNDVLAYQQIRRLLNEIAVSGLTLNASIVVGVPDTPEIILTQSNVADFLTRLNSYLTTRLLSSDIPQADDLRRVFRIVDLIDKGNQAGAGALQITPRQIAYYKHAARALGFLDDMNLPTSQGRHLLSADENERLRIAKSAFAGSAVGFAWLEWSGVHSLDAIDPETARQFLSEVAVNLSENTRRRRAITLRSWARAFSNCR